MALENEWILSYIFFFLLPFNQARGTLLCYEMKLSWRQTFNESTGPDSPCRWSSSRKIIILALLHFNFETNSHISNLCRSQEQHEQVGHRCAQAVVLSILICLFFACFSKKKTKKINVFPFCEDVIFYAELQN